MESNFKLHDLVDWNGLKGIVVFVDHDNMYPDVLPLEVHFYDCPELVGGGNFDFTLDGKFLEGMSSPCLKLSPVNYKR